MILAQITDPHLRPRGRLAYGVIDTEAALRRAVQTLATLVPEPDCVVVTGDLTDCGLPEEYEIVRDCLAALSCRSSLFPETMIDVGISRRSCARATHISRPPDFSIT
jgi:3',5'-cyclic AMP phosphodiesterase CpdA